MRADLGLEITSRARFKRLVSYGLKRGPAAAIIIIRYHTLSVAQRKKSIVRVAVAVVFSFHLIAAIWHMKLRFKSVLPIILL
jgi:hypothetical protein